MKKDLVLKIVLVFVLTCSGATGVFAEPYTTIINNGSPQNRVDIAIVGDGYTAAEQTKYQTDVDNFMQGTFAEETYLEYKNYYNVHRIDVVSNESGADHPESTPAVFVDTAFNSTYNCNGIQRLICSTTGLVNQVVAASLPPDHYDVILVLVNDPVYGGSGGSIAVSSTHPSGVEIVLHELGHSFGRLADEYAGGGPSCNPNVEPSQINATRETERALIKWNHWIDSGTTIPTTTTIEGIPGLFEGARYCDFGLYRPTVGNKMRSLGRPFRQINNEQQVKRVYNFVSPIDFALPDETTVILTTAQTQDFSITTPQPLTHDLNIEWQVDGVPAGSGSTFELAGSTLSAGQHTVVALVSDPTTFVINDPGAVLQDSKSWVVDVTASLSGNTRFDFDGDSKADISIFRPGPGDWWYLRSSDGQDGAFSFGEGTDVMVPADFTGDGISDFAFWRPSSGEWFVLRSDNTGFYSFPFGADGDIPAPGDFDGDGIGDPAVYRPSSGTWFIRRSSDDQTEFVTFGAPADKPLVADYDNDGKADVAVYKPDVAQFWQLRSDAGLRAYQFGTSGDMAMAADFSGDGTDDIAVWRPATGEWLILRSEDEGFYGFPFGAAGDVPAAADYDGDGTVDPTVYRESVTTWFSLQSTSGTVFTPFGAAGDRPVPGAYVVP